VSDVVTVVEQPTTVTITDDDGGSTTVTINDESATVITAAEQGPQGPPGESGDANFTQSFTSAASVTVNHNLGKYPAVTVMDSAGDEVEGDIDYVSINTIRLNFSAPFSGVVSCN
jgi:hypothetical protein